MAADDMTLRDMVNERFGHPIEIYDPIAPDERDPRADATLNAIAALATRVEIRHPHAHEAFCECWVDGRLRAYCANAGTALVLGAAAIGLDAETMNRVTEGLQG